MKRLTTRDESGFYHLRRGPKGGEINKITVVQHLGRLEDVALRPVSREQVEGMEGEWVLDINKGPAVFYCSSCGESFEIHSYEFQKYRFCPFCMAPMTDEAVDILLKRLEVLKDGTGD